MPSSTEENLRFVPEQPSLLQDPQLAALAPVASRSVTAPHANAQLSFANRFFMISTVQLREKRSDPGIKQRRVTRHRVLMLGDD
jgi:hypothetical protein